MNGTGGTDHSTASTVLVLCWRLKRGGIVGNSPTLAPTNLFEARGAAPTMDMRGLFKGALCDHLGLDRKALATVNFLAARRP